MERWGTQLSRELPDATWANERSSGSFDCAVACAPAALRTTGVKSGSFAVGQDDRLSRNMSCYPIVLKDYGIVAYFARGFRYNEQALVYSGLLADEKNSRGFGG